MPKRTLQSKIHRGRRNKQQVIGRRGTDGDNSNFAQSCKGSVDRTSVDRTSDERGPDKVGTAVASFSVFLKKNNQVTQKSKKVAAPLCFFGSVRLEDNVVVLPRWS